MTSRKLYRWWLPPRFPGDKSRLSSWHMDEETAAKHGALKPELHTLEVRHVPDDPGPRPGFPRGWRDK